MVDAQGIEPWTSPVKKAAALSRRLLAALLERSGGKRGADLIIVITGATRRMSSIQTAG
jgi:hypothetical protein